MEASRSITTLFTDIGGVLLTNGWDRNMRQAAAAQFGLDFDEMDERHHLTFDTYEAGKLSLDEYLDRVVFHKSQSCSREAFKQFMYAQSQPLPGMMEFVKQVKAANRLKVVAVSNEGRELTLHRGRAFDLMSLIDVFVSSSFVHFRKPDHDIFTIALDVAQVVPENVLYIDDRPLFVQVASDMGIRGIVHKDLDSTRQALSDHGLAIGPFLATS